MEYLVRRVAALGLLPRGPCRAIGVHRTMGNLIPFDLHPIRIIGQEIDHALRQPPRLEQIRGQRGPQMVSFPRRIFVGKTLHDGDVTGLREKIFQGTTWF